MIYDLVEVNTVVAVHYMYLLSHSLLFQYARDCLTDNNRPCGRCPICQYDFQVAHILLIYLFSDFICSLILQERCGCHFHDLFVYSLG